MRILTSAALLSLLLISNALGPNRGGAAARCKGFRRWHRARARQPIEPAIIRWGGKEAADGSTRMVPAVPCSTAARETDGTTTCIGLKGPVDRSRRPDRPSETTVGRAR